MAEPEKVLIPTQEPWVPADDFAARLKLVRHSLALDYRAAARMCGLSWSTWRTWEQGTKPQDALAVAAKISEALGVDREWLAWGEIDPVRTPLRISRKSGDPDDTRYSGSDIDSLCTTASLIPSRSGHATRAVA